MTAAEDSVLRLYQKFQLQQALYEKTVSTILEGGVTSLADQMQWSCTTDVLGSLHTQLLQKLVVSGSLLIRGQWYADAVEVDLPVYLMNCLQSSKLLSQNIANELNATLDQTESRPSCHTLNVFAKVGRDLKRITRHLRILLRPFLPAVGGSQKIELVVFHAISTQLCESAQFHASQWIDQLLVDLETVRDSFVFSAKNDPPVRSNVEEAFYVVTGLLQALQMGGESALSSIYSVNGLTEQYTARACDAFKTTMGDLVKAKNYIGLSDAVDREVQLFALIFPRGDASQLKKELRSVMLTDNSAVLDDLTTFTGLFPDSSVESLRSILNVFENTTLDQHFLENLLPGALDDSLSYASTIDEVVMLLDKCRSVVKEAVPVGRSLEVYKAIDQVFRSGISTRPRFDEDLVESLHALLKRQGRASRPSTTVAKKIEQTIRLAQYVNHNDIFFLHYRRRLSARLFTSDASSLNLAAESESVQLLAAVLGPQPNIAKLWIMLAEFPTRVLDRTLWLDNDAANAPRVPVPDCLRCAVDTAVASSVAVPVTARTVLDEWRTSLEVELTTPQGQTFCVVGSLPLISLLVLAADYAKSQNNDAIPLQAFSQSLNLPDRFVLLCLRSFVNVGVMLEQIGSGENAKQNPTILFSKQFLTEKYVLPRFKLQW